jgi:hypothetical protein
MTVHPRRLAACAAGAALLALTAVPALALQAQPRGVGMSDKVSTVVTVKSVDPATRHLVVTTPDGADVPLSAGSAVRNLAQLKPGDKLKVTYMREVDLVISPPNQPLPKDAAKVMAARAKSGDMPAGAVAAHITVTGAVVGVDTAANTLKLVSPQGGEVHVIAVKSPEGRKALSKLKVGDKITAYVTEGLLVTSQPG